mmetsp:Transcript_120651/g.232833  ORF Transcript_120651/g.232833 Transcript_120651/m.232833 type:complete len:533 (-) Transcript_120651:580-2178(-)
MPGQSQSTLSVISAKVETRIGRIPSAARCHRLPRTLEDDYTLTNKVLGEGYAGSVLLATSKSRAGGEKQTVAVKSFKLKGLKTHQKEQLLSEIEIFLCMDHPHVARLLDVYEDEQKISLVMECVEGGELFDRVIKDKRFPEPGAAHAMRQMLLAVQYIHSHGIVHRDLKLENFLYDLETSDHLKMIDFGFSKFLVKSSRMKTTCGTTAYVAPEVLKRSYTSQCDLWSMGVIGFVLLSGHMPFYGDSEHKLKAIKNGRYKFKEEHWKIVSNSGREFIKALLHMDPAKRLTAKTALEHKWIFSHCGKSDICKIDSSVVNSIVSWINAPKLERACLSMVSWSLTNSQHALVRDYFVALDRDHDGMIKWTELKDAIADSKGKLDDEKKNEVLEILDGNPEKSLNYSDFLAAMTYSHINLDEATMRSAFRRFDTDTSGKMSVDSFALFLGNNFEGEDLGALVRQAGAVGPDGKMGYTQFARVSREGTAMCDSKPMLQAAAYDGGDDLQLPLHTAMFELQEIDESAEGSKAAPCCCVM